jgi:glycosyltransferase involved in cell wall biosynthesis
MRLLHLVNHCRLGHGNVHAAVDLACVQSAKGDEVMLAAEDGEFRDLLVQCGVVHVPLRQRTSDPRQVLAAVRRLRAIIRDRRIEIVHAHMMAGALIGYCATRLTGARLVTTVHNSFDGHSALMRLGDRVAAVSEAERIALIARGFNGARTVAIVNAPLGSARARYFAAEPEVRMVRPAIATVCGLHERKGVDTIIEAFRQVAGDHPAELHIVGDGPDRSKLEALAAASGYGPRIHFHGSLRDPQKVLAGADIFVLASHAEPLGLVNLEARAAGCAIVASRVGGIPEALDDGAAGILVPPDEPGAFAGAIRGLLEDPARLAQMKRRAGEGLERFSIDRLYGAYRSLYAGLIA